MKIIDTKENIEKILKNKVKEVSNKMINDEIEYNTWWDFVDKVDSLFREDTWYYATDNEELALSYEGDFEDMEIQSMEYLPF